MIGAPEVLPATSMSTVQLVLLHGWGSDREIWRPLLAHLRPWADVTLLDIPGCAPGLAAEDVPDFESVLDAVLAVAPQRAVFVGWSLGGQLALALAAHAPERVSAVVTLCSNPRFISASDWPGISNSELDDFRSRFSVDPAATLKRFRALQVQGARRPRSLLRRMGDVRRECLHTSMASGLKWLADIDQRSLLADLSVPQLHLLAKGDALVPIELYRSLERLLAHREQAVVQTISAASHVAPVDSSLQCEVLMKGFLDAQGLCAKDKIHPAAPAKLEVASSFSRAAQSYDSAAALQRDVGNRLLSMLPPQMPADEHDNRVETIMDLGSGTGYFRSPLCSAYPQANYLGVDIAEGMIRYARDRSESAGAWLVGDAESLPLASASCDIVFSSLTLQWCYRPEAYLAELSRVLKPGGICLISTLGQDTLRELRQSWEAVDAYQHVNRFLDVDELQTSAVSIPDITVTFHREQYCMHYERVAELLAELKTLGAHNMNQGRPTGLTSRKTLLGMLQAYEEWRRDGLLPATYDVIFVGVTKLLQEAKMEKL
ncbi:MAG: malonyl-ACP O-methyltransferase BioC [Pseudomonadota bacterium]